MSIDKMTGSIAQLPEFSVDKRTMVQVVTSSGFATAATAKDLLHEEGTASFAGIFRRVHDMVFADVADLGHYIWAVPGQVHLAVHDRMLARGRVLAGLDKGEALPAKYGKQFFGAKLVSAADVVEHEQGIDGKRFRQLVAADVGDAAEAVVLGIGKFVLHTSRFLGGEYRKNDSIGVEPAIVTKRRYIIGQID
jgi:hypothetical protein